jgi:hypothetical protein
MKLRRGGFLPLGILLVLAGAVIALTAATGGSASTATPFTSSPCPPMGGGRQYCVTLTTFNGVQATGGQKVEAYVSNFDQNTLTNLVMTFHPITARLDLDWSAPMPSNCVAGTGDDVVCTLPNVAGLGAAAKNTPPPPPNLSPPVTLYFSSQATGTSPSLSWNVSVRVQEGPSGPPNTSVRDVTGATSFGTDPDSPLTIALPGSNVVLGTTTTGKATLKLNVPGGSEPYETSMTADDVTSFCFGDLTCYPLQLTSSVPGATGGLLVWHFVLVDSKDTPAPSANKLNVIHRYDFADVTANPATDTFTGDFRAYVGARIGTQDYYVRNATATTFKLSTNPTGSTGFFDVQSSPVSLSRIRIIGDDKSPLPSEVDTRCNASLSASTPAADLPRIPSINASTVAGTKDVDVFVCDSGNGNVGGF